VHRSNGVRRLLHRALLFALLLGWCGALLLFRYERWHSSYFLFLAWNLLLAVIPAIAAALLALASERRHAATLQGVWFAVWLLFLPNAPYIVTDFIHLAPRPPVPSWYDVVMMVSAAGTGLFLGYSSIADVQAVVSLRFGRRAGWSVAVVALLLSGFGIYLGRFLRWNSWDAVANPGELLHKAAERGLNPMAHPRTIGVSVLYGVGLALGYLALRIFAATRLREHERES
jgi:uncharacterized membrane protein